jgi:hypothetical protein
MTGWSSGALATVGCIAVLALAGCGSGSTNSAAGTASHAGSAATATSNSISAPTTKFVLHAGLAFGAFHHFIYLPIKSGVLRHPLSHKFTLVKAGLAALFVAHELRLALADAKASKVLRPVVAPLTAAANKLEGLKSSITGGSVNPSDLDVVNAHLTQAGQSAQSVGHTITSTVPSASQLASGAS